MAMSDHAGQRTLAVKAGDAVLADYRLLHGTHANRTDERRDSLLFTFVPNWRGLAGDLRAHLVQHPAQPRAIDAIDAPGWADLLPDFDGLLRDVAINRVAPDRFVVDR